VESGAGATWELSGGGVTHAPIGDAGCRLP
jgi:hypothetical protein